MVDPKQINLPQQIGETLSFYEDIRQMALMAASSGESKTQKLQAMSVALQTERDKNDFLTKVGVYSAPVMHSFQAMLLQQIVTLHAAPERPTTPEHHIDHFFNKVAGELMEVAIIRGNQLQGEYSEVVDATP